MKTPLPPDPETMNDARAEWARRCLVVMSEETGVDPEDALQDLLCNLMHLADRTEGMDFADSLEQARRHYAEETAAEVPADDIAADFRAECADWAMEVLASAAVQYSRNITANAMTEETARAHALAAGVSVHWNRLGGWDNGHAARLAAAVLEDANCQKAAEPLCEMFTNHYSA